MFFGCYVVGYVGLALAPVAGAWLWALLVGVGTASFPLSLTLIGLLRLHRHGDRRAVGVHRSVGYLVAAPGPFRGRAARRPHRGWKVPLLTMAALTVPLLVAGLGIARPAYVEDELSVDA